MSTQATISSIFSIVGTSNIISGYSVKVPGSSTAIRQANDVVYATTMSVVLGTETMITNSVSVPQSLFVKNITSGSIYELTSRDLIKARTGSVGMLKYNEGIITNYSSSQIVYYINGTNNSGSLQVLQIGY